MAVTIKNLANGTLPTTKATLYTVPTNTSAVVLLINVVNNSGTAYTLNLYYKKSGDTSRLISPKDMSLDPGYNFPLKTKITMAAGDTIEGDASSITYLEYVISGVEIVAAAAAPSVDALPPIQKAIVTLTPTDIAALSGGTFVVIPAVTDMVHLCLYTYFIKEAGTAWTLNGVTRINLKYDNGISDPVGTVAASIAAAGFIDQAAAQTDFAIGPSNTITYTSWANAETDFFGTNVVASKDNGTDLSGGTGNLQIVVYYRSLSLTPP